jgi:hypothetical protein
MTQLNLRVGGLLAIAAGALLAGEAGVVAAAKPTILLNITNHRKISLVELHATADGESSARSVVKALEPGGSKVVKFRRGKSGKNCFFELHATYEDGTFTDFTHFDLCKDETINLVD